MRVTLQQIADRAGVCKATVSLALRNASKIPTATRERIQALAAEMGYRKHPYIAAHMADLRRHHPARDRPTLAYLTEFSAAATKNAFFRQRWLAGAMAQAGELGCHLDVFYSIQTATAVRRLQAVLRARGILGVIVGPFANDRLLSADFFREFSAAALARRERPYAIHSVDTDHVHLAMALVENIAARGYRRPAVFHHGDGSGLNERLFKMAYEYAFSQKPGWRAAPMRFGDPGDPGLSSWLRAHRPDVLISNVSSTLDWLQGQGYRVPANLAYVSENIAKTGGHSGMAGFDQNYELAGARAVNLVIEQIYHNEPGPPAHPLTALIQADWRDGETLPVISDAASR